MDNYELLLTEQAQENIEDTLATLITAAQEIATASEKDFEKIKAKKWYKRLWELVTFNNDNQKIQARGVGNLAKLNEITMKAIVLVSKQSKDIAEKVHESLTQLQQLEDDVSDLYEQQIKIISVVQKIKRGFETEDRFDELSQNQRDIIFAVLHTYALEGSNDDTGKLLATLRGQAHDTYEKVNYSIIETELTPKSSQKMLYTIIHAYSLLLTGELADEDHEIFQYIGLSGNEKKKIHNRVKDDISIFGKEEYIKFFDAPTEEYSTCVEIDDIDCTVEQDDISINEKEEVENIQDFNSFSICIYCEKSQKKDAGRLQTYLSNLGNECKVCTNSKNIYDGFDFIIMLGDVKLAKQTLDFGRHEIIFDRFGCNICKTISSNKITANFDNKNFDYNKEEFISFYKETCLLKSDAVVINESQAKDILEKHAKEKPRKWRFWEGLADAPITLIDKIEIKDSDGVGKTLIKAFGILALVPIGMATSSVAFLMAIPEELVQDRIEKMKSSNFDKKFVGEAQSDILYIKLSEYIWNEQLKNAK